MERPKITKREGVEFKRKNRSEATTGGENSPTSPSLIISIRGLPNGITLRVALTSVNLKGIG